MMVSRALPPIYVSGPQRVTTPGTSSQQVPEARHA